MGGWLQDLRFGLRSLRNGRGTTVLATVALGIAFGAAATLFAVVNGILIRPLPFPHADRLVAIWQIDTSDPDTWLFVPAANATDYRRLARSFESLSAASNRAATLTSFEEPETPLIRQVSHGYFETLGVEPVLGRAFLPEEDRPGGAAVTVLSHELWLRRFGGDPAVLGRTTELDGIPHEIIGVMPEGFDNPAFGLAVKPQLWYPYARPESGLDRRLNNSVMVGRLAPGVSREEAQQELDRLAAALEEEYPETNRNVRTVVVPLAERQVRELRPALVLLFSAVLFVLVVAAGNVANLVLTRSLGRHREIAVRRALGAGRRRVLRQLVTESLLLTLSAGGLGLLAAAWGSGAVTLLLPPGIEAGFDLSLDGNVAAFTLAAALACGLAFGLLSGLHLLRPGVAAAGLSGSGLRTTADRSGGRLRRALVVGEVALSLVLLVGAGLTARSFAGLARLDPGFDPNDLLTFRLSTRGPAYDAGEARLAFYREVLAGIESLPGVVAAGVAHAPPFFPQFITLAVRREDAPPPPPGREPQVAVRRILPGYFEAMRIPRDRGRDFSRDDDAEAPRVAAVSRTMAERFWPGRDPVGEGLLLGDGAGGPWRVVAVIGDVRSDALPPEPAPIVYVPLAQDPMVPSVSFVVRAEGDPRALLRPIEEVVRGVDRGMVTYQQQTMEELLAIVDFRPRFLTQLLSLFAALALGLAATGTYAVLSYAVSQRRREIGIRMALGAQRREVTGMVLKGSLALAAVGVVIGLGGALGFSRLLQGQLYGVSTTDPATYGALSALLVGVVLAASYLPARRAARVDPARTLGTE